MLGHCYDAQDIYIGLDLSKGQSKAQKLVHFQFAYFFTNEPTSSLILHTSLGKEVIHNTFVIGCF